MGPDQDVNELEELRSVSHTPLDADATTSVGFTQIKDQPMPNNEDDKWKSWGVSVIDPLDADAHNTTNQGRLARRGVCPMSRS